MSKFPNPITESLREQLLLTLCGYGGCEGCVGNDVWGEMR